MQSDPSYITEIAYPAALHPEIGPRWLCYACAIAGVAATDCDAQFRYLELGCGPGTSLLHNARLFPNGYFVGCDLNPDHIALANKTAAGASNVELHTCSFADWAKSNPEPFDFVVMHGVLSWVNRQAQDELVAIVKDQLRSSGLLYVSYNCLPGWAPEMPLRHLLSELAEEETGGLRDRANQAWALARTMRDAGFKYFAGNAEVSAALDPPKDQPFGYLAHEYFNPHWRVFYSNEVAETFAAAGCELVGSATLTDNYDMLSLEPTQAKLIDGLQSVAMQELASDFATNRAFRRDIFAKSPTLLSDQESALALGNTPIALAKEPPLSPKVIVPRGALTFQKSFMDEVTSALTKSPVSISALSEYLAKGHGDIIGIRRNLEILVAARVLKPWPG